MPILQEGHLISRDWVSLPNTVVSDPDFSLLLFSISGHAGMAYCEEKKKYRRWTRFRIFEQDSLVIP